ncbi:hypothetical protein TNCV_2818281 [Trichonephila clavipes]|nr:hypothetical protein TNCV_2818281 [Trichonephila clavipes]
MESGISRQISKWDLELVTKSGKVTSSNPDTTNDPAYHLKRIRHNKSVETQNPHVREARKFDEGEYQFRCPSEHLTMVRNCEVCRL